MGSAHHHDSGMQASNVDTYIIHAYGRKILQHVPAAADQKPATDLNTHAERMLWTRRPQVPSAGQHRSHLVENGTFWTEHIWSKSTDRPPWKEPRHISTRSRAPFMQHFKQVASNGQRGGEWSSGFPRQRPYAVGVHLLHLSCIISRLGIEQQGSTLGLTGGVKTRGGGNIRDGGVVNARAQLGGSIRKHLIADRRLRRLCRASPWLLPPSRPSPVPDPSTREGGKARAATGPVSLNHADGSRVLPHVDVPGEAQM